VIATDFKAGNENEKDAAPRSGNVLIGTGRFSGERFCAGIAFLGRTTMQGKDLTI